MWKKIFFILLVGSVILPLTLQAAPNTHFEPDETVANANSEQPRAENISCSPLKTFDQLVRCTISKIINPLVALVLALALLYFLWGVAKYIKNAGDQKARDEGKKMMFYGIIALFVMVSVWGLVRVLTSTFNLDNSLPAIPRFPGN